ncbi:glycosyltransferase [Methanoculleus chikugoensis]|uniref:glycosyltransferase n=1 Tax=Methanoculleus chikugoensis TaxID=118126 RepID=UPI001FB1AD77|nr:glycosyltransferase [Methanoculleus chikugoensis]
MATYADATLPGNVSHRFTGYLDNAAVLEHYRQSPIDVFINVSESEGIPVSIMEAESCGIPVIATAVGGIPEIVSDATGILLPEHPAPRDIAKAVVRIAADPGGTRAIRSACRENWEAAMTRTGTSVPSLATCRPSCGDSSHPPTVREERQKLRCALLPRKPFVNGPLRIFSEAPGYIRVLDQVVDHFSDLNRLRRHEDTILPPISDRLRYPPRHRGCNDGFAHGHRLKERYRQPVPPEGDVRVDIAEGERHSGVLDISREDNVPGRPPFGPCELLYLRGRRRPSGSRQGRSPDTSL